MKGEGAAAEAGVLLGNKSPAAPRGGLLRGAAFSLRNPPPAVGPGSCLSELGHICPPGAEPRPQQVLWGPAFWSTGSGGLPRNAELFVDGEGGGLLWGRVSIRWRFYVNFWRKAAWV